MCIEAFGRPICAEGIEDHSQGGFATRIQSLLGIVIRKSCQKRASRHSDIDQSWTSEPIDRPLFRLRECSGSAQGAGSSPSQKAIKGIEVPEQLPTLKTLCSLTRMRQKFFINTNSMLGRMSPDSLWRVDNHQFTWSGLILASRTGLVLPSASEKTL